MKKYAVILVTGFISLLILSLMPEKGPDLTGADNSAANVYMDASIPTDVEAIFQKSCMDCHGTGGRKLALAKLNLSEWDKYSPERKIRRAEAICKELSKGSMPPKRYRNSHPERVPTAEEVDMICSWSASLLAGDPGKAVQKD